MSKKMLVNATHPEENRVAIVLDGILTELDVEVSGRQPTKGNIYKAVVVRVEPGLQAAFVDYGAERLGFLQIDEVNAATVKPDFSQNENKGRPRINDLLQRGQEILVQITKEERGTKGAALTTYLSLAGRFMVCMPGSQTRGVSRKVESDAERKQLKKAMASLDLPDDIGYIVRTAGLGKTQEELQRDFNYLTRLYDGIRELGKNAKAPSLVYKESNLVIRSIRDYFTTEMDEVLIDDPEVFKEARDFFQRVMPEHAGLVKLHQERRPIFSRYQIEDQIETINQNKVQLPSGGSIVLDSTEALVAIDVNSGKMTSEQGVEATAFKTNLEAAAEIGRQLRLRDLGGLIVIDFIDMRDRKHARDVENALKKSLENDKARVAIGRISSKFGLLEMSRQRIKSALTEGTLLSCPHCQGTGRIKSPESLAVGLMRRIQAVVAKGQVGRIDAQLPLDVASYLLNNKREELFELERRHNLRIHIHGRPDFLTDQIDLDVQKREKEKPVQADYVEAGNLPPQAEPEAADKKDEPVPAEETTEKPKRRRRRRRKPAAERIEGETVPSVSADARTPADREESVTAGEQAAAAAEGVAPPGGQIEPVATATEQPPVAEVAGGEQRQPSATAEAAAAAPPSDGEKKPRRRRSSRRKPASQPAEPAKSENELAASSAAAPETVATAEPPVSIEAVQEPKDQASAPLPAEAAEKPKRRRAPRRKPETRQPESGESVPAEAAAEQAPQPKDQSAVPLPAETAEKPKRRRAPRRKPESGQPESGESAQAEAAAEPAPQPKDQSAAPLPAEAAEQPKRRRAPRKQPAAHSEETTAASEATDHSTSTPPAQPAKAAASDSTEPGQKPRRPGRKPAAPKKPAEATSAAQAAAAPEAAAKQPSTQPAATESDNEAKPKRRRAPRKKAANKPPETE
jgi:ribonuclease E